MKRLAKNVIFIITMLTVVTAVFMTGCTSEEEDVITLRVSNWEEYIDLGDWDDEELIDLEGGTEILGVNPMYEDFENWYYETYNQRVKVEYSTFGTNEDLYNQITIGDVYDLVCPSEYMIMKMMREDMLVPLSKDFYDKSKAHNYYANNVSPYIKSVYDDLNIDNQFLSDYAAGYMWGTLGIVYNPEEVPMEDAAHWNILTNDKYYKRVTIKDSVRDAYFGAIAIQYYDEVTAPEFVNAPDYHERLSQKLNLTDADTVNKVQDILSQAKDNVYSFETDAGKADLVTGKVVANEQWSGDAVYTMDQAEEDGIDLCYSAPLEGTNLWFDGWVMLKCGIADDTEKQQVAEAFINYVSMPENAIRNMYYIGYTSVISGGESGMIFDYLNWCYSAEEDEEDVVEYPVGYFFDYGNENADEQYTVIAPSEQTRRQLYAQYPTKDVVDRSVVMACFDEEGNIRINRMWTNVRCFDLKKLF